MKTTEEKSNAENRSGSQKLGKQRLGGGAEKNEQSKEIRSKTKNSELYTELKFPWMYGKKQRE